MTLKNKRAFCSSIIFLILIWSMCTMSFAANKNYKVTVRLYRYDQKNKKYLLTRTTENIAYNDQSVQFEIALISEEGKSGINTRWTIGEGSFAWDLRHNLKRYLLYQEDAEMALPKKVDNIIHKKWMILINPIFDRQNRRIDTIFSIEVQTRTHQKEYQDSNAIYNIEHFVMSEKELKDHKKFSRIDNGESIHAIIKDDMRPKIKIDEKPEEIMFCTFDISDLTNILIVKEETDILPELRPSNQATFKLPLSFDMKYKNSEGTERVYTNIPHSQLFMIDVFTKKGKEPDTGETEFYRFTIEGKLFPVTYKNNEYQVELVLRSDLDFFNILGTRKTRLQSTVYRKYLTFKENDVIEVRLPPNWPNISKKIKLDPSKPEDSKPPIKTEIEKQSLIIKLSNH